MVRPTVGTVSAEFTTTSQAITVDATTRGLWIALLGGSNTGFTHTQATISIGGKSFTFHETQLSTQVHCCGYYLEDVSGRTNNTVSLSGGTFGSAVNQYRWRAYCINHADHKVLLAAEGGTNAVANGGTTSFTLNPGAGVDARAVLAINYQDLSGGVTGSSGLTSPTNHFSHVAGPSGTSHGKNGDSGSITGSTSVGYTFGAGSNTQRALIGTAWKEGAALAPRNASRFWILGALPSVSLPVLPLGLVAARSVPATLAA